MNLSLIRIPKYFYACTLSMDLLLDETKSLNKNELTMFLKCNIKGLVHAIGNSNEVKSPLWLGLFRIKEKQKKTGVFDITNISLSAQPSQHFPTKFGGIFIPGYLTINRHISHLNNLLCDLNKSDIVRFTSWVTTAFGCLLNEFKWLSSCFKIRFNHTTISS